MRLQLRKPSQALDKAYARQPLPQEQLDGFRQALAKLFARVDENESEAHQQTIVADFLRELVPANTYRVAVGEAIDLIVQAEPVPSGMTNETVSTAVIETRKVFAGEMMTPLKNNVRALHELILSYFENAERESPNAVCQLVITDVYNWFLFDELDFRRFFYDNVRLKKLFQIRQQQKKSDTYFFTETARILRDLDAEVPVTYLNLREVADTLTLLPEQSNRLLVPVVKLFSPAHLLKQPFSSGTDAFNQRFYEELLHIIGIHEQSVKKSGSRLQRLPETERSAGSLLENTITQLRTHSVLAGLDDADRYGEAEEDQLIAVGLELCLTWLTRVFFLKVNEQLFPRGLPAVRNFAELNELFFDVITVPDEQRSDDVSARFGEVLHLNCPLFIETELERKTITIRTLADTLELPRFAQTVVANADSDVAQTTTLDYLLTFLDGYDFSTKPLLVVRETDRPRISAAILGIVFEKIDNQYTGSLIPGRIVTHMVRHTIRQAAVSVFSALPELAAEAGQMTTVDVLKTYIGQFHEPDSLLHVNAVINRLRIVDPAVGSGRFLVSALNELIALKAELGLLIDHDGQRIHRLDVSVVDDELLITNASGELFSYALEDDTVTSFSALERQRIQQTIFREKQTLLENCLFGVDRKAVSINFCQFRLWTELLKSTFFVETGRNAASPPVRQSLAGPPVRSPDQMVSLLTYNKAYAQETAPAVMRHSDRSLQITTNLKIGDALVSRFEPNFQGDGLKMQSRNDFLSEIKRYKAAALAYKQSWEATEKEQIHTHIQEIESALHLLSPVDQKETVAIRRLEARLAQSALPFDVAGQEERLQKLVNQLAVQKKALTDKRRLFEQAVEWRYVFPEVLDDSGNYVGFDAVLGYPPVIRSEGFARVKTYFQRAFPNAYSSKADPYALLVELGMKLLKPGGELVYWLPTNWLKSGNAGKLRDWLSTWSAPAVDHAESLPPIDNADMQRMLIIQKTTPATAPPNQPNLGDTA
ncbi:DUF7149 domain-containing protein [Spirosoma agri]|uniref:site-specific DNA-methyltransferase (adenine-specific) n=1 Tax=Spirosoma agri TaxID=1987381 RepID=A0A6M0ILV5_9BACT|nr:class I SAM-dependent DNA methyltransferase [Spirosoma agri]NEU69296.1 class I SAM-dependent DNA methyltransferase [Spirosoma agri]